MTSINMSLKNSHKEKIVALDSLKGLAACIIAFVWHYQHFGSVGSPMKSLLTISYDYGWLMVELFFCLSGFGIMKGYGDVVLSKKILYKEFILRRWQKLYPLFILTTIVVTIFQFVHKENVGITFVYPNYDVYHFVLNALLLQNGILETEWSFNSPSWCISILMVCYTIFFWLMHKAEKREAVNYALCLVFVALAVLRAGLSYPIFNPLMARGISCFFVGVCLEMWIFSNKGINQKAVGNIALSSVLIIYCIARFIGINAIGNFQLLFILVVAPMLVLVVVFVPWVNRLLLIYPLRILGSISMEIYLWHFPIQLIMRTVEICLELDVDYSSKTMWFIYASITLAWCLVYKYRLQNKYIGFLKMIQKYVVRG